MPSAPTRTQAVAYGDIDRDTARALERLAQARGQKGQGEDATPTSALPVPDQRGPALIDDAALVAAELETVTVQADHPVLQLTGDRPPLSLPFTHQSQRRRVIVVPPGREGDRLRAMEAEDRTRILAGIAMGRSWMGDLVAGRSAGIEAIAMAEQRSERSVRMTLSLVLLSPRIVRAIVEARLPRGILRHLWRKVPALAAGRSGTVVSLRRASQGNSLPAV